MISIVMGLHRYDAYASQAIESILLQSFHAFEFIIVANGGDCDSIEAQILVDFSSETRLRVLKTPIPQLAHALNLGIDGAQFALVARMDADDIAWPKRLEKQLHFMECNGLDMVGCNLRLIDEEGRTLGTRIYPRGRRIDRCLGFRNCFAHNTVLIRRDVLLAARGYNAGFNTEDYDLWLRLRRLGVKWDNMNETLLDYRIHDAASQRRLLGYAEATALATREFILNKSLVNLLAVGYHFIKALLRARD